MSIFQTFDPALRTVDSDGVTPTRGPHYLRPTFADGISNGLWLEKCREKKTPELLGEWSNLVWDWKWRFLGLRARVDLTFLLAESDPTRGTLVTGEWGLNLLKLYFTDGLESEGGPSALQFNLFGRSALSPWRPMAIKSVWEPRPFMEKQFQGFQLDLSLESLSLIQPAQWGDYGARNW